jgi:hypothetical protein
MSNFFLMTLPLKRLANLFELLMSKNDVLMLILTFFHQKFCRGMTLPAFALPTGFTVITDHPIAREVPMGRGPQ